jgi:hypothetical protein
MIELTEAQHKQLASSKIAVFDPKTQSANGRARDA